MSDNSGGEPSASTTRSDGKKSSGNLNPADDPMESGDLHVIEDPTVSRILQNSLKGKAVAESKTQSKLQSVKSDKFNYSSADPAPYVVYVENTNNSTKGTLNAIKVGSIILKEHRDLDNKINTIISIGRNRIKVEFSNYLAANSLINSPVLNLHSLEAFIPKFLLFRKGIIKYIAKDLTDDYIKANIKPFDRCKFCVDEVTRIKRKPSENEITRFHLPPDTLVDTQSVIVSFRCSVIPKFILINKVRCEVTPYVQRVLLCFRCYRYGHMGKQCKSSPRCIRCAGDHAEQSCKLNRVQCIHCQGNHLANQLKLCPEFVRQKEIKSVMSTENISFYEANKKIPRVSYATALKEGVSEITITSPSLAQPIRPKQQYSSPTQPPSTMRVPPTNINKQPISSVSKRARPSSPSNKAWEAHKRIIAPCPTSPGLGVALQQLPTKSTNQQNAEETFSCSLAGISQIIFEVVKSVIDSLSINKEYNIDHNNLSTLINSRLSSISNNVTANE